MAKKGQKFNKYTKEFRQMIINEVLEFGYTYIAIKYNINKNTVQSWYLNYKKGILNKKPRPEGTRDLEYYKVRYEILKKLHDFYNCRKNKK